jgi:hypothetical protein
VSELEQTALDEAFVASFANLFKVLIDGLITGDKQLATDRFERGLKHHRDAYKIATEAISDSPE